MMKRLEGYRIFKGGTPNKPNILVHCFEERYDNGKIKHETFNLSEEQVISIVISCAAKTSSSGETTVDKINKRWDEFVKRVEAVKASLKDEIEQLSYQ